MNIFSKLFNKKKNDNVGGMEDFMLLIRVYYQATLATQLGINNLAVLSDLRIFKQTYHVATQNNKIGLAEKKHCQKIMQNIYQLNDNFFKEIDSSIKKTLPHSTRRTAIHAPIHGLRPGPDDGYQQSDAMEIALPWLHEKGCSHDGRDKDS